MTDRQADGQPSSPIRGIFSFEGTKSKEMINKNKIIFRLLNINKEWSKLIPPSIKHNCQYLNSLNNYKNIILT